VLSPRAVASQLAAGDQLAAGTRVAPAGVSVGGFLAATLDHDVLLAAATARPPPAWLEPGPDGTGRTVLHWVCVTPGFDADALAVVRALVDLGWDPDARDADGFGLKVAGAKNVDLATKCGGKTVLHHLCTIHPTPDVLGAIQCLLDHGADPNATDYDGNTPGALAAMHGHLAVARLVGGDPNLLPPDPALALREYERRCTEREQEWERGREEAAYARRSGLLEAIQQGYTPLHAWLYRKDAFLPGPVASSAAVQLGPGVWQVPLLDPVVCAQLADEVDHFNFWAKREGIEVDRPNSMNDYGVVLNDIGFLPAMDRAMAAVVGPLARQLLPEVLHQAEFGSQHSFIVRYAAGEDLDLKPHADDSDITLNVCLGHEFEGASLYFHKPQLCVEREESEFLYPHPQNCPHCVIHYKHRPGMAVLHRGAQVHGVQPLAGGERLNLVIWCRKRPYPKDIQRVMALSGR